LKILIEPPQRLIAAATEFEYAIRRLIDVRPQVWDPRWRYLRSVAGL
jgi:hypothetical protein